MSKVHVEFYGIPRNRAGVEQAVVETRDEHVKLQDVFHKLALQFPRFGEECMEGDSLGIGLTANLDGERFVADPLTLLSDGSTLLIMSSDAGG